MSHETRRKWLPTCCSLLLAMVSFFATRGADGRFLLFCIGFAIGGCAFVVTTLLAYEKPSGEFALQSVVLLASAAVPLLIENRLEEMGGVLNFAIPVAALFIVVAATIGLFLKSRRKSK